MVIKQLSTKAPGKLILTGEHAVVYGCPAIAFTVNRYFHCQLKETSDANLSCHFQNQDVTVPLHDISKQAEATAQRYQAYLNKTASINSVLTQPADLIIFALNLFSKHYQVTPQQGLDIRLDTDLAIGCGMGASAALITGLLQAFYEYFDIAINIDSFYKLALQVENLQHGISSGLDIYLCLHGGIIHTAKQQRARIKSHLPTYCVVNSGKPDSSTGECVNHVKEQFATDTKLWTRFSEATQQIKQALTDNNQAALQQHIKTNHQLLTTLGVVPKKIQDFIQAAEALGFAAKISGAGSIHGDNAGMILLLGEQTAELRTLCQQAGYTLLAIEEEKRGARSI